MIILVLVMFLMNSQLFKYKPMPQKSHKHEVWLSDKALNETEALLEKYADEYTLSDPFSLSKLCSIGLMMIGSLSTKELYDINQWFKTEGY